VDVALRFHPGCPFGKSYVPSMVALLRDVVSDTPCGIHRTHIDREYPGKLAVPRVLGQFKGAAIKLWPTPDHGRLLVGEGIETTLSAAQHLDISPAWALGTAYTLSNFPVLETVTELHIAVDNDAAGQSAAKLCASRYYGHGREKVYLHTPKQHNDFNDVIRSLCHGR
jgi:hypothetical protein